MKATAAVSILTIYLILYAVIFETGLSITILSYLFLLSPLLLIGTIYIVLKDDQYTYPELGKKEEWGYLDKTRDELGLF